MYGAWKAREEKSQYFQCWEVQITRANKDAKIGLQWDDQIVKYESRVAPFWERPVEKSCIKHDKKAERWKVKFNSRKFHASSKILRPRNRTEKRYLIETQGRKVSQNETIRLFWKTQELFSVSGGIKKKKQGEFGKLTDRIGWGREEKWKHV